MAKPKKPGRPLASPIPFPLGTDGQPARHLACGHRRARARWGDGRGAATSHEHCAREWAHLGSNSLANRPLSLRQGARRGHHPSTATALRPGGNSDLERVSVVNAFALSDGLRVHKPLADLLVRPVGDLRLQSDLLGDPSGDRLPQPHNHRDTDLWRVAPSTARQEHGT
jgi:hypothetical protein